MGSDYNLPGSILQGGARIYVDGTAPTNELGFTQGGVTLRKARDLNRIMADQVGGTIKINVNADSMYLTTTLLEATKRQMMLAFTEPATNTSASGMSFGAQAPVTSEHTVQVTGVAPAGGTRTYTFYRAVVAEDIEHVVGARDAVGVLPFALELLKDPDHGYLYGTYIDS